MNLININKLLCKKCGICVNSCPVSILLQGDDGFPYVPAVNEKRCLLCGHCEISCAASALKHKFSS